MFSFHGIVARIIMVTASKEFLCFHPPSPILLLDQTLNLAFSDFNRATFALNYRRKLRFLKIFRFQRIVARVMQSQLQKSSYVFNLPHRCYFRSNSKFNIPRFQSSNVCSKLSRKLRFLKTFSFHRIAARVMQSQLQKSFYVFTLPHLCYFRSNSKFNIQRFQSSNVWSINYRENYVFSKCLVFMELLLGSFGHSFKRVFMLSPSLTDIILDQTLKLTIQRFQSSNLCSKLSKKLRFLKTFRFQRIVARVMQSQLQKSSYVFNLPHRCYFRSNSKFNIQRFQSSNVCS